MSISIQERPPLRHTWIIESPSGHRYRWAADAGHPEDVPSGRRWDDTMPGGFATASGTLPRDPRIAYSDLGRLSNVCVIDGTGEVAWEGRLEETPRSSGEQLSITPQAVGWQAHLNDHKGISFPYIDRDLSSWRDPSTQRKLNLSASSRLSASMDVGFQDTGATTPALMFNFTELQAAFFDWAEAWYYGNGADLGEVAYDFDVSGGGTDPDWIDQASLEDNDLTTVGNDVGTDHNATDATNQSVLATAAGRKYARVASVYTGAFVGDVSNFHSWLRLRVFGDGDLTKRGTAPDEGFYDSDVIAHALQTWCPLLSFTEGPDGSIQQGDYIIPHLSFQSVTPGDIVNGATKFSLRDWAVWEARTFYLHNRGARGRSWVARVEEADLQETGPSAKRLWESILVEYQDVDGTARTCGPPGSGAHTESELLKDLDPENPANELGITMRDKLVLGTHTAGSATETGRRFLEQAKLLDRSGQAKLTGWVMDSSGALRPYSQVHSGDTIRFVNASDTCERRIVKADHSEDDHSVSIDLDAPPDGMAALLERFDASLVALGV